MQSLSLPQINSVQLLDDIIANKKRPRKERLSQCRAEVIDRYTYYETHFGALNDVEPMDESKWERVKKDLHSCFEGNVVFDCVKKQLYARVQKCPYCLLNRPNTLDHYFDKSAYPEYSVFVPNLIPCCSECNTIKGIKLFDESRQRQFIHFYIDNIPTYQCLFVRFTITSYTSIPTVKVFLQFNEGDTSSEQIIQRHFNQLRLLSKYQDSIIGRVATVIDEFKIAKKEGMLSDDMRRIITIRFQSLIKNYGCNYWETCMYEGILNSVGFLESYF